MLKEGRGIDFNSNTLIRSYETVLVITDNGKFTVHNLLIQSCTQYDVDYSPNSLRLKSLAIRSFL